MPNAKESVPLTTSTSTETVVGATIDVKLDPGNTGTNNLTVDITDDGAPFLHATDIRARVKYLDDDFGEYFIPLANESPGDWRLDNITIGGAGAYQLDVTVVRSDSFDSHVSTRFSAKSDTLTADLIRPSAKTVMIAFGVLIAIAGLAYLVATAIVAKPIRVNIHPHYSISAVVITIGIAAILNAFTTGIGIPDESKGNPFPLSQASVQIGLETYTTNCATCHGDTGKGDGPAGLSHNPPPADLAVHVPSPHRQRTLRFHSRRHRRNPNGRPTRQPHHRRNLAPRQLHPHNFPVNRPAVKRPLRLPKRSIHLSPRR